MKAASARRCSAAAVFMLLAAGAASSSASQPPPPARPLPQGQRIEARDGDTITIDDDARVKIVRRRHARVRAIYNSTQRWLVLLASDTASGAGASDPRVDVTFTFHAVAGEWPLGERWEGDAVIEQYSLPGEAGRVCGFGVALPQGTVQLFHQPQDQQLFAEPAALAVLFARSIGAGGARGWSFDEAERLEVAVAKRNAQPDALRAAGRLPTISTLGIIDRVSSAALTAAPGGGAPLRVGGDIAPPRKIYDAAPVLPDAARQAGIRGAVILDLTIGIDGIVANARVLRSIPLLDDDALECVRRWRFEPVLLNGTPVPVMMTATVNFP